MDLDELLFGDKTNDMTAVAGALNEGYAEEWQVALIRRYLITDEQRHALFLAGACEHDLLNGRIGQFDATAIFTDWNSKLGETVFA